MTVRFTLQGCKVETTFIPLPDGAFTESVTLSVDPASQLSLMVEHRAAQELAPRAGLPPTGSSRVRSTRHGFELVPERS
jgi:hypothetical protein